MDPLCTLSAFVRYRRLLLGGRLSATKRVGQCWLGNSINPSLTSLIGQKSQERGNPHIPLNPNQTAGHQTNPKCTITRCSIIMVCNNSANSEFKIHTYCGQNGRQERVEEGLGIPRIRSKTFLDHQELGWNDRIAY